MHENPSIAWYWIPNQEPKSMSLQIYSELIFQFVKVQKMTNFSSILAKSI